MVVVACKVEVITKNYKLTELPEGYVVHPKYVLEESKGVDSLIRCAIRCNIEMLCKSFVFSETNCWIARKLVLAQDAQALGSVKG